jgi:hypothetical protein
MNNLVIFMVYCLQGRFWDITDHVPPENQMGR